MVTRFTSNPGVAGSIPLLHKSLCWQDVKRSSLTHSLTYIHNTVNHLGVLFIV